MRLKAWIAALLAALILTLGMFAHPRECAAGPNDDVEFLQPPSGEAGDPDSGGGGGYFITFLHFRVAGASWAVQVRLPHVLRVSLVSRTASRSVVEVRQRFSGSKR